MKLLADKYGWIERAGRQALAVEDLSDAEIEAIMRAELPAEATQYDHELTVEGGADT